MARRNKTLSRSPATSPAQGKTRSPVVDKGLRWPWLAVILFGSGIAALIYQVIWIKQLALIVGVDVYAITTGVSAFFLGLAVGGWLWGRRVDQSARPLLFYAALELGIAVLGFGATLALAHAASLFVSLQNSVGFLAWILPFTLIGLPALLMGGTLPALMSALSSATGKVARSGGHVYSANTLGAVAGTLATTFLLIPALGVQGTALTAATLNVALAFVAFAVGRKLPSRDIAAINSAMVSSNASIQDFGRARLAVALYAIAGGIALGYEIVWTQTIVQFMSTRSFAFTIVLATYLSGLATGSAIYARFADRVRNPWGVFGLLVATAGLLALLQVAGLGAWLMTWQSQLGAAVRAAGGSDLAVMCARFALAALCVVFTPTLLLGAAFPAALRLCASATHSGRDIGVVLALNTAGGIAGTFLAGFVLVPLLGLVHTLTVLAVLATGIGAIAAWRGPQTHSRWLVAGIAIIVVVVGAITPADNLARLLTQAKGGTLVSYEESPGGTVAVVQQGTGPSSFRRLYIQGVSNSGDTMASLRYMRLQALLPLLIHQGEPKSAMVIALGTGITAGALTQYPGLEHRVTAELLPAVVRAVPRFSGNYGVTSDPKSEIRVQDGRHELLRSSQRYDLITLEPPPPSATGVVNLYSRDFYELARTRLQPNGLFAQWLPIATQNDEDTRSLVRSFLEAFPNASLWTTELHEMLLVGSVEPMPLDANTITERFNQPQVTQALSAVGVTSPAALLATWITDRAGLERYVDDAPPVTDDRPLIEYAGWVRRGEITRVLPKLLDLHSDVPVQNASTSLQAEIGRCRDRLMEFYAAGLYAYAGDRERWSAALASAMTGEEDNAYFRYVAGE